MTSSSSRRHQQHRRALVTLCHDLLVDILDGAHVQAAGGLHGHQQLGIPVDLTGNDRLLLVAAGHAAHDGVAALGRCARRTAAISRSAYSRTLSERMKPPFWNSGCQ